MNSAEKSSPAFGNSGSWKPTLVGSVALAGTTLALTSAICSNFDLSQSPIRQLMQPVCPSLSQFDLLAFFRISYPILDTLTDEPTGDYHKGFKDLQFILGWIFLLAALQKFIGDQLAHLYRHFNSVKQQNDTDLLKFKEQAYLLIYYVISLSAGLSIYFKSEYHPLLQNSHHMWLGYPIHTLNAEVKTYYLIQAAFWLQQLSSFLFFTPVNERRKDHWAMVVHHVITTSLVLSSYCFHLTKIGNAVLICMDTSDVFLCLAKSLKYLRFQSICDVIFGLFVLSWIVTRHGLYFFLWWSIQIEGANIIKDTKWDPWISRDLSIPSEYERPGSYYSKGSWVFFNVCFAGLQCLLIYWFFLIVRVITKVVSGKGAEDVRED